MHHPDIPALTLNNRKIIALGGKGDNMFAVRGKRGGISTK